MEVDSSSNKIEDLPVKESFLRARIREEFARARDLHRSLAFDTNRFLESEILTEKDVVGICSRIKRRKHATEEDLIKLSNAFFQSEANISAFIKVTGAINVIVKEFIGNNDRQLLAAKTLCNMSLGNDVCCSRIATFAGVYLMIYLRNLHNNSFNKICIWTLQNLVSSNGHKSIDILMSQQLLPNTLNIVVNSGDMVLQHEAMQLLDLIVEKKWESFSMDDKEEVSKAVLNYVFQNSVDHISMQCLHRILNFGPWNLNSQSTDKLFGVLSKNIINEEIPVHDPLLLYFSIKILLLVFKAEPQFLSTFLTNLINFNTKLSEIINEILKIPKFYSLINDLIHFAGLIITSQPVAANYLQYDDLVNNLQIPKFFEF